MDKLERSKYNVSIDELEKRTYDGIVFASILEMRYYRDVLCPLRESGDIISCELQKPYELQPSFIHDGKTVRAITYVADFFVRYKDGREEIIDTKGMPDSAAKLKRKMFWFRYPDAAYRWVGFSQIDGGWCDYDYIKKQRAERKRKKKLLASARKEEKEN